MSETSSVRAENCRCDYSYLRSKKGPKFEGESSTHAQFKPYQLEKKVAYDVPKPQTKHYDPESLQTSYKTQFTQPKPSQDTLAGGSSSLVESYMAKKAKVPFYSETEYKKSFQAKEVKVQKQPIYEYKPNAKKFEGSSSYKEQFQAKKNAELVSAGQEIISASKMYQRPKIKFQGQSSYKQAFPKYDVKMEKQPEYKFEPSKAKFEGQTSYKTNFKQLPKEAYKSDLEHCPVHPDRIAIK